MKKIFWFEDDNLCGIFTVCAYVFKKIKSCFYIQQGWIKLFKSDSGSLHCYENSVLLIFQIIKESWTNLYHGFYVPSLGTKSEILLLLLYFWSNNCSISFKTIFKKWPNPNFWKVVYTNTRYIHTYQWVSVYFTKMSHTVHYQRTLLFLASLMLCWQNMWLKRMCSWDDARQISTALYSHVHWQTTACIVINSAKNCFCQSLRDAWLVWMQFKRLHMRSDHFRCI